MGVREEENQESVAEAILCLLCSESPPPPLYSHVSFWLSPSPFPCIQDPSPATGLRLTPRLSRHPPPPSAPLLLLPQPPHGLTHSGTEEDILKLPSLSFLLVIPPTQYTLSQLFFTLLSLSPFFKNLQCSSSSWIFLLPSKRTHPPKKKSSPSFFKGFFFGSSYLHPSFIPYFKPLTSKKKKLTSMF